MVVTTSMRADPRLVARANLVATRCDLPYRPRRGSLRRTVGDEDAYIVRQDRDELRTAASTVHVHAGMTRSRLANGSAHPLIRALAPSGQAAHIADGTLGLAGDSLHIAATLGCEVFACELSPVVYSLAEEGLQRLARTGGIVGEAAARIRIALGDSARVFGKLEADAFDGVVLAPMYLDPDAASPGYDSFRSAAAHAVLSEATVAEALRIAPRVVVKAKPGEALPTALAGHTRERLRGRSVDYWVLTRS